MGTDDVLVALRDARERAIARLSDAFAKDELDVDEFDRRIELAHRAEKVAALDELVKDLAPPSTALVVAAPAPLAPGQQADDQKVVAVFGNSTRAGTWTPPRHLRVYAVFGNTELDFREARLGPGAIDIQVTACFGNTTIIVPPSLAVEMNGSAVLGNFEHSSRAAASLNPGRALLRIHGLACLGNVEIQTRLPGESERDTRRRRRRERRAERRALRSAERKQLPPHDL